MNQNQIQMHNKLSNQLVETLSTTYLPAITVKTDMSQLGNYCLISNNNGKYQIDDTGVNAFSYEPFSVPIYSEEFSCNEMGFKYLFLYQDGELELRDDTDYVEDCFYIGFNNDETNQYEMLTPENFSDPIWEALIELKYRHFHFGKERVLNVIKTANKLLAQYKPKKTLKGFETSYIAPISDSEHEIERLLQPFVEQYEKA